MRGLAGPADFLALACSALTIAAPTELVEQAPVLITDAGANIVLVDFGKVAFGNLKISPPAGAEGEFKVHFGEAFEKDRINRTPEEWGVVTPFRWVEIEGWPHTERDGFVVTNTNTVVNAFHLHTSR